MRGIPGFIQNSGMSDGRPGSSVWSSGMSDWSLWSSRWRLIMSSSRCLNNVRAWTGRLEL